MLLVRILDYVSLEITIFFIAMNAVEHEVFQETAVVGALLDTLGIEMGITIEVLLTKDIKLQEIIKGG